jgi:hypothetical protein
LHAISRKSLSFNRGERSGQTLQDCAPFIAVPLR